MENKIIGQIFDEVRACTTYSESDSLIFAMQLIAWTKLSFESNIINDDIQVQNIRLIDIQSLKVIFEKLSKINGLIGQAFTGVNISSSSDIKGLNHILDICIKLGEAGILKNIDPTDSVNLISSRYPDESGLPREIADLMVGLASIDSNLSVYTPWDYGAQLAGRALKQNASVYLESIKDSALPALVGIILGGDFTHACTNPISSPQAIENGKLRKFDIALAMPPYGLRYELDVVDRDWFSRFPERTNSGIVLTVRHLLSQTKHKVIIAAPNTLLSSPGYEKTLREDLIQKGIIESVISLPSGLFAFSNVAMSILVMNPGGGNQKIRFINADNERYREPISKARARLTNVEQLLDIAKSVFADNELIMVPADSVMENDAQLLVSRYLLDDSSKKLHAFLASQKTVDLGSLVSTVRPMPTVQDSQNYVEAFEVGATDLPKYGYIKTTGRSVKIDPEIAKKNKHQFLKPLDIVLIVKGSVGKVGVVSTNIPDQLSTGWVAGQSATILRVDDQSKIDPRVLAIYLRSALGQELLKTIVSGATIQLIQLRELLRLQIALPSIEEQSIIANALEEESAIQDEIDTLVNKQAKLAERFWGLE